jgi:predicted ATPase
MNVLLGRHGAGKSNLLSFFKLLQAITTSQLQRHIAESGGANSLLFLGPKVTTNVEAQVDFEVAGGLQSYAFRLASSKDGLIFEEETIGFNEARGEPRTISPGTGHQESLLPVAASGNDILATFLVYLKSCEVHEAPAPNVLAARLVHLQTNARWAYNRIVKAIALIVPDFHDFVLTPESGQVTLNWRCKASDHVFSPHQLSSGTLRAMALVSLLWQPNEQLPGLLIVDGPEMGLHPYALQVVASLLHSASHHTQILIATQSSTFLDHFSPEDIVLVDRSGLESKFSRQQFSLDTWLEEYSLGELWEKNVLHSMRGSHA